MPIRLLSLRQGPLCVSLQEIFLQPIYNKNFMHQGIYHSSIGPILGYNNSGESQHSEVRTSSGTFLAKGEIEGIWNMQIFLLKVCQVVLLCLMWLSNKSWNNGQMCETKWADCTCQNRSKFSVNAFLWGNLATNDTLALYERFKTNPEVPFTLALRNVRCTDFAHLSIQSIDKTRVFIDPLIPETASIKQWFLHLHDGRPSMGFVGATRFPPKTITLSEIHDEIRTTEEASFLVSAVVSNFDMQRPQWYTACVLCKKKYNKPDGPSEGEQQNYFCYACTNTSDTTTMCYNLRVKLQDDNSDLWVTVFNDTAEQLLGVKASDLATLMETDLPAYEDVYYKSRFQAINTHVIINVTPFEERDHKQFVMQSFRELDTNIDPVEDFEGIKLLMGLEDNVDLDDTFY